MSWRNRVLSFGGAGLVLALAAVAGPLLGGITGEAVAIALACLGGIAIVSLVFLEIGLGEDRERARERSREDEERARERAVQRPPAPGSRRPLARRRRPR
jgi:hypothetical protein